MSKIDISDYSCPTCGADVVLGTDTVACNECSSQYPVEGGIVDFRLGRKDYYFNPVPREEMRKLVDNYSPERWLEMARGFLSHAPKGKWLDNVVVDGRYAWKVFLDLGPSTKLLDLGCGLGNLSKNLAPHVGKVYAMDLTYERLEFARNRFSTFNQDDDISLLAAGDSARLPFRDASLDIVVMSGVLEWVGEGDMAEYFEGSKPARLWRGLLSPLGARSPRRIQIDFLKEIRRVLKPDGQLFVAIENRLNYEYFGERPDHHSGLPFGSLLPRPVANLYSLYRNRKPYRTYTHTLSGYRRLMKEAGFSESEFLGLRDGYSAVKELIPASGHFPFWAPRQEGSWRERVRRKPSFVPAYGIVTSSRQRPWGRMLDDVLDGAAEPFGVQGDSLRVTEMKVSSKDKLIIHAQHDDQHVFIRLPFNEAALASERNNFERLNWLRDHRPSLIDRAPCPLLAGEIEHQPYFVETGVDGMALADTLKSSHDAPALLRPALELLRDLNQPTDLDVRAFGGELYAEMVTGPLRRLAGVIASEQLVTLEAFFRRNLEDAPLPHGLMHGDCSASNVLMRDGVVAGVLDWENSRFPGIPAIDAVGLLVSSFRRVQPSVSIAGDVIGFARREDEFGDLLPLMDQYYEWTGTDASLHEGIVLLAWLQGISDRLRCGMIYDENAIDLYVGDVIDLLEPV
jgi:SAM-dependent methyltransferase/aminoglycoside phosphotransferase (APT) family kinase protein